MWNWDANTIIIRDAIRDTNLTVPYDLCVSVPISHLLTIGLIRDCEIFTNLQLTLVWSSCIQSITASCQHSHHHIVKTWFKDSKDSSKDSSNPPLCLGRVSVSARRQSSGRRKQCARPAPPPTGTPSPATAGASPSRPGRQVTCPT